MKMFVHKSRPLRVQQRGHRRVQLLIGALMSLGLTACGNDMSDLETFVQQTKLKHAGQVDPLPTFPPYESFAYTSEGKRDPFRAKAPDSPTAVAVSRRTTGPVPDPGRRREALESFPLDALNMVGILEKDRQQWGLVITPDGNIHRVLPGNYLGENHGKIVAISETAINLMELVPDGLSGWKKREASIAVSAE